MLERMEVLDGFGDAVGGLYGTICSVVLVLIRALFVGLGRGFTMICNRNIIWVRGLNRSKRMKDFIHLCD